MEYKDSVFAKLKGVKDVHIEGNDVKNADIFLEGEDLDDLKIINNKFSNDQKKIIVDELVEKIKCELKNSPLVNNSSTKTEFIKSIVSIIPKIAYDFLKIKLGS